MRVLAALVAVLLLGSGASPAMAGDRSDCLSKDFSKRLRACTRLIESGREPRENIAVAYANRGSGYYEKNDYEHALADYLKSVELAPNDPDGYLFVGNVYFRTGTYNRAIEYFSTAIKMQPSLTFAHYNRAATYEKLGELDKAITDFRSVVRLNPGDNDALRRIADLEQARLAAAKVEPAPESPARTAALVPTLPGVRVALVIGNSAYREVAALPNATSDADLTASALRAAGFGDVVVAKDLDRAGLVAALQDFGARADKADWAVVYYAGHGIEVGGRNYLIPVDARLKQERNVDDEAVALDRVLASVEGASKIRLIALDACRDNPFTMQMRAAGAKRSIGRGLARIEPDGATLVLYAAREGTTAADGDGSNSPFAEAFAKRIQEPGVEISLTLRRLSDDVVKATASQQEPVQYGRLPVDELYFVPTK